ncbi:YcxB family protein [Streptomyces orinoci]|uniref:YcxB family protein n=1 Tax=Streptomyces orinoci TaxID=67339 RepID=A0ABV3JQ72_STRON|nr:YcxB family protein [Streptomyces orinoci]
MTVSTGSVSLAFQLTVEDFRAAIRARNRVVTKARLTSWASVLLLVLAPAGLALHIHRSGVGAVGLREWALLVAACYFFALQVLGYQALFHRGRLRREGPRQVTVDEQAVICAGAESTTRQAWMQFGCYLERRDLFVLLSTDRQCMVILPKRGLAGPADEERLRALLESRLPRA